MRRHFISIALLLLVVSPVMARRYSESEIKAMFWFRATPDYPRKLQQRSITGSGIFRLLVDEQGKVTAVSVFQSTGHPELDAEAVKAFMRWRAKPGPKRDVDIPLTFARGH